MSVLQLHLGSVDNIFHEHGDGQETDAAGDRRDGTGDIFDGLEVDVTDELLRRDAVDADIDDRRAGLDHVSRDEVRAADCRDEDVRLVTAGRSFVWLWQIVTVAFLPSKR